MSSVLREFINHPDEMHAVFNGFFTRFFYPLWFAIAELLPDENAPESHYWRFGFLLAIVLKAALVVWVVGRAF